RRGRGGERPAGDQQVQDRASANAGEYMTPAALEAEFSPENAADERAEPGVTRGDEAEEMQPAEFNNDQGDGERRRRRRGRRGGRRRHRGPGGDAHPASGPGGADRAPRMQLELRPGEPGYSGPAEEFGEEPDFDALENDQEPAQEEAEESPPSEEAAAEQQAQPPRQETAYPETPTPAPPPEAPPPTPEPANAAERAPSAYNVAPPQEVTGPAANPRRGWWRR
ncbi:MAG TPA: hypothetical protein VKV32_02485, partial [Stellaceae bacterium]|nr:hypothetical protein [Stellaceae bacterium]